MLSKPLKIQDVDEGVGVKVLGTEEESPAEKAGLKKRIYPHLIRHDSFTHLLESGCDIGLIQKIAGHKNIATTNLYLHTSHTFISKINSPINNIKI